MNGNYFQHNPVADCLKNGSEFCFSLARLRGSQDFYSLYDTFSKCSDFLYTFSRLSQEQKNEVIDVIGFACSIAGLLYR